MTSTYLGSITMVLKFPLTRAASTNGLQRNKGLGTVAEGEGGTEVGLEASGGKPAEVGVGDRLGPRGARFIPRLLAHQWNETQLYTYLLPK